MSSRGGSTHRRQALVSTPLAPIDVGFHSLTQLFEEKGAFEPHFHYGAVETDATDFGFVVGGLDLIEAAFELDAFAVVGLFYAGREGCAGCCLFWLKVLACGKGPTMRVVLSDWRRKGCSRARVRVGERGRGQVLIWPHSLLLEDNLGSLVD